MYVYIPSIQELEEMCAKLAVKVLRVLRAQLKTLSSVLRVVPKSKIFLRRLLYMREKQILTSVIEIQKENEG